MLHLKNMFKYINDLLKIKYFMFNIAVKYL